jgi:hypothetical protein
VFFDIFELLLQLLYHLIYQPAVGFELGFPRASGSDTAPEPFKVAPLACQPGEKILMLRQFDLQFPLVRLGVTGKYIQDKSDTVDDFYL